MRIKIQLTGNEIVNILAEYLDQDAVQYSVRAENIDRLIADCNPDGELISLEVSSVLTRIRSSETMKQGTKKTPKPERPQKLLTIINHSIITPKFWFYLGRLGFNEFLNQPRLSSDQFPPLLKALLIADGEGYV